MIDLDLMRAHVVTYGETPEACLTCQVGEPRIWIEIDGDDDRLLHHKDLPSNDLVSVICVRVA